MGGAERVVIALGALGEAGQAAAGAQRADAVAAAGQDLVRIGLMADVPDQAVARGVEDVVQRRGQFDDAKAGAEMAAGDRHRIDGFLAQFVGDLPDLFHLEPAQIFRRADGIEKRRFAKFGHSDIPILHVGTGVRRKMGCTVIAQRTSRFSELAKRAEARFASLKALPIGQCDPHHFDGFTRPQPFLVGIRSTYCKRSALIASLQKPIVRQAIHQSRG